MTSQQGILRFFRPLRTCDKGATAVEAAFTAPLIIFTMIGIIEILFAMFVTALMEGAVREASRFGITGFTPGTTDRAQMISDIVNDHTLGLIEISPSTVSILTYDSFDDIGEPEPVDPDQDIDGDGVYDPDDGDGYIDVNSNGQWDADQGSDGPGDAGEVVLYTVTYDWEIFTPLMAHVIGDNGKITLSSSIAVRNEPWDSGSGGGGS